MIFNLSGYGDNIDLSRITANTASVVSGKTYVDSNGTMQVGALDTTDGYSVSGYSILAMIHPNSSDISRGDFVRYYKQGGGYICRAYNEGVYTENGGVANDSGVAGDTILLRVPVLIEG